MKYYIIKEKKGNNMGDEFECEQMCSSKIRETGQRVITSNEEKYIKVMITFAK